MWFCILLDAYTVKSFSGGVLSDGSRERYSPYHRGCPNNQYSALVVSYTCMMGVIYEDVGC